MSIYVKDASGNRFKVAGIGLPGADGVTFTPNVDAQGNLSWTNDGGLENPEMVNIAGTPATINGVNALTIQAGGNVQMSQEGGVVTISAKITGRGVVLPASGWVDGVQTVSVTGVPADENTFRAAYTYPGTSAAAIASAAPMITGTGLNSVTFTCTGETPTEDLVVYVEITEAVYVAPPSS